MSRDRAHARGAPAHGERMVVWFVPGSGRVRCITGKKIGNAVERNRARRILRAAWRLSGLETGDEYDVVLSARPRIEGARAQDLMTEMTELVERARLTAP
ncbi:MAG: ribonuclease P protein component [Actinomycetota bacterium]